MATANELLQSFETHPVIAAVRDGETLETALASRAAAVFLLGGTIVTLADRVTAIHRAGKAAFVHLDLMQGLKADAAAVEWLQATMPVDGVISTRTPLLKAARELNLITIQRLFLVDSASLTSGIRMMRVSPPDFVEVMPGLVPKAIRTLKMELGRPVIAGGMITEAEEAARALRAGAAAVSTSQSEIWG